MRVFVQMKSTVRDGSMIMERCKCLVGFARPRPRDWPDALAGRGGGLSKPSRHPAEKAGPGSKGLGTTRLAVRRHPCRLPFFMIGHRLLHRVYLELFTSCRLATAHPPSCVAYHGCRGASNLSEMKGRTFSNHHHLPGIPHCRG